MPDVISLVLGLKEGCKNEGMNTKGKKFKSIRNTYTRYIHSEFGKNTKIIFLDSYNTDIEEQNDSI